MKTQLKTYAFNEEGREELGKDKHGKDWPVVYLINNDSEIYVGETSNAYVRFDNHLNNDERKELKYFNCIFDDEFNKSAILDIEQNLIQLVDSDGKFQIQNRNNGQSDKHNYYQRDLYLNKLDTIWSLLRNRKLADKDFLYIKNNDLYKYSPYTTLTEEQRTVSLSVLNDFLDCLDKKEKGISIVHGSAGTGKTITAINMINALCNADNFDFEEEDESKNTEAYLTLTRLREYVLRNDPIKVAFVLPMTSIRNTLKMVFKKLNNHVQYDIVKGPSEIVDQIYDVIFVDEAHRLCQRKNIANMGGFDKTCDKLGLDKFNSTQLDWVIKQSKYTVLFYDENQTVKGSDITSEQFNSAIKNINNRTDYQLTTQMRCLGGGTYLDYINHIFNCDIKEKRDIENYEFKLYEDIDLMIRDIKEKDKDNGLCRVVAGYSWEWISKKVKPHTLNEIRNQHKEDITIQGHKYIWNLTNDKWINSDTSLDEIGCIHTTQGYDLNYVGVIFGEEIDYNPNANRIEVDLNKFYDTNVKRSTDPDTVRKYIINAYKVMMTRGIKGCYVFACNPNMQNYLRNYINSK